MRARSRTFHPDWPEARRAPEPTLKAAHAAELDAVVASGSCPVQVIPRGVSGLVEADVAGTRWAWLWRTSAPAREARHMALAIHRGPSFSLAPGCARMVAADGRRCDD